MYRFYLNVYAQFHRRTDRNRGVLTRTAPKGGSSFIWTSRSANIRSVASAAYRNCRRN